MLSVPREKYPEMNWRAADKVAAWKLFKRRMQVIFVADQIPEERQWAIILVAGGNEAYNCWDTLEDTVQDCKKVDQVWEAFEKSFEQSTLFWHFRDAYLADFRQDESETMEERVNIGQITKATLKASKVGHCASWSSWLSCLQLWHKVYPSEGQ